MAIRNQSGLHRHLGIAAFVAAVASAIVFALVVVGLQGDAKRSIDQVQHVSGELEKRIGEKDAVGVPELPPLGAFVEEWNRPASLRDTLPAWTFNRRPDIEVLVEKPVDKRKDLWAPVEFRAEVDEDYRVTIAWKPDPRTTAKIKGYEVFRWKEGEKPPEKPLHEGLIEAASFTDEDWAGLVPMTVVRYQVRAHTDEEVKTPGGKAVTVPPISVELPDDRRVHYFGEGGGVQSAQLYVFRFRNGEWPWERFTVKLGEPVGREATVLVEGGEEKAKIDFTTGKLLVEIGEEIRTIVEDEPFHQRDGDGKPMFDAQGQPVMGNRKKKKQVVQGFVLLVDGEGNPQKIIELPKGKRPVHVMVKPGPNDPPIKHLLWDLDQRKGKAPSGYIKNLLSKRIKNLRRFRRKLVGKQEDVDENLLKEKIGILYRLRWDWLEAKDNEAKFPDKTKYKEKAVELTWYLKDLESFLSLEGWKKEKEEWELDYGSFRNKSKKQYGGREPARWPMAPPPEKEKK